MARVGTTNLNLGTWIDEENPGAGSQIQDNTGLNGNWIKIDTALGTEHNANGTHKANSIVGTYLRQTSTGAVVDETTIEFSSDKMRVKDLGITGAKIASGAISSTKLASDAVETAKILDANVTAAKLATDAVETVKIKDLNVTLAKCADDVYEHPMIALVFTYNYSANNYRLGDKVISTNVGIPVPKSTNIDFIVVKNDGTTASAGCNDAFDSGDNASGNRISVGEVGGSSGYHVVLRNGAEQDAFGNTRIIKDPTQDAVLVVYLVRRR